MHALETMHRAERVHAGNRFRQPTTANGPALFPLQDSHLDLLAKIVLSAPWHVFNSTQEIIEKLTNVPF